MSKSWQKNTNSIQNFQNLQLLVFEPENWEKHYISLEKNALKGIYHHVTHHLEIALNV